MKRILSFYSVLKNSQPESMAPRQTMPLFDLKLWKYFYKFQYKTASFNNINFFFRIKTIIKKKRFVVFRVKILFNSPNFNPNIHYISANSPNWSNRNLFAPSPKAHFPVFPNNSLTTWLVTFSITNCSLLILYLVPFLSPIIETLQTLLSHHTSLLLDYRPWQSHLISTKWKKTDTTCLTRVYKDHNQITYTKEICNWLRLKELRTSY